MRDLAKAERLDHIDLANTEVTDAGLLELSKLTNLTWLQLGHTQVTANGVQAFQKVLPKCTVLAYQLETDK